MKIYFAAVECYPAAKVGGLADVVGALPKYLELIGQEITVVMPMYNLPWINDQKTRVLHSGEFSILKTSYNYKILEVENLKIGYRLVFVDIPALFYREGVYADRNGNFFMDEAERYTSFAKVFLDWVLKMDDKPDVIHCHDHHTGLIPFMMTKCSKYGDLKSIPTVLTIHNEKYRGRFSWQKEYLLPDFEREYGGLLDWDNMIDPLASGIKCAWRITTVSPSYMDELLESDGPIKSLFEEERKKAVGLLNGIDNDYWNPATDKYLEFQFKRSLRAFKEKNKKNICDKLNIKKTAAPLISFIGRLAYEKGADLLPNSLGNLLEEYKNVNVIVLGTGHSETEKMLEDLGQKYRNRCSVKIMYNEGLAHEIYGGSDFLLMPSRVEPCGLNQMYAMRYGTIPIVRSIGGLKDTVEDVQYKNGYGFRFKESNEKDILEACGRALKLYDDPSQFTKIRDRAVQQNFSWEASVKNYLKLYKSIVKYPKQ